MSTADACIAIRHKAEGVHQHFKLLALPAIVPVIAGNVRCHKDHTGSHKTLTKCLLQLSDCYNTNNCQQAWLIMKTLDVASIMCQQCDQEESHSDAQLQQKIISI